MAKFFVGIILSLVVLLLLGSMVYAETVANETNETNSTDLTAVIGNARTILYPKIVPGQTTVINRTILVINQNPIEVKISLNASDEFKQYVDITDSFFVLQPDESKDARFTISLTEPGTYEGKILVTFLPNNNDDNVSGVGLASNIIIIAREESTTNSSPEINGSVGNASQPGEGTGINVSNITIIANNTSVVEPNGTIYVNSTANESGTPENIPPTQRSWKDFVLPVAIIVILFAIIILIYSKTGKSRKGN